MTTIPERIREEAMEIARKVVFEADGELTPVSLPISAHPIALALQAAEKRGREEAAKIAENCVPHGIHPDDLYRWRQTADTLAAAIRSTN